tara:strand:- start:818 stop:1174 length:357 start_codon:yes stop_codon:yes gene_type:complete
MDMVCFLVFIGVVMENKNKKKKKPTFIYVIGQPGCGKTRNANSLAEFFKCDFIIDDGTPSEFKLLGDSDKKVLVLAHPSDLFHFKKYRGRVHFFEDVRRSIKENGGDWSEGLVTEDYC